MIIQQDHVRVPPCFPRRRVQLEPIILLDDNMSAGDSREVFLRTLDLLPQRMQLGVPHCFQIGHRAPVGLLASSRSGSILHHDPRLGNSGIHGCLVHGGGELGHEASKGAHLALEFLGLLADLDELGAVLIDILLQITGCAVLQLL